MMKPTLALYMERAPRRALPMVRLSILLLVLPLSTKASEALALGSAAAEARLGSGGAASGDALTSVR